MPPTSPSSSAAHRPSQHWQEGLDASGLAGETSGWSWNYLYYFVGLGSDLNYFGCCR